MSFTLGIPKQYRRADIPKKYSFKPHPYFTAFAGTIKSAETRLIWTSYLHIYMTFHDMKGYAELVGDEGSIQNSKRLEMQLIEYLSGRKEQGITPQTLANHLSALHHFYKMNDIDGIKWEKVRRYLGERVTTVEDKAYTHEQIAQALEYADHRVRALILIESSTGIRIGGIVGGTHRGLKLPYLKWGDLEFIERHGIFSFNVYARTPAKYLAFCTPECAKAIKEYIRYREQEGETITAESPLIRDQFRKETANSPQPLSKTTAARLIAHAFIKAGLRKVDKGQPFKRKENMLTHGFRKFARRNMRKAGVDPLIIEYLIGHQSGDMKAGVSKLMMTYDPAEDGELLAEYLKAIPNLTISSVERERIETMKEKERADNLDRQIKGKLAEQDLRIKALELSKARMPTDESLKG